MNPLFGGQPWNLTKLAFTQSLTLSFSRISTMSSNYFNLLVRRQAHIPADGHSHLVEPYSSLDYHPHNLGVKARSYIVKLNRFISSSCNCQIGWIRTINLRRHMPLCFQLHYRLTQFKFWWSYRDSNPAVILCARQTTTPSSP